MKKYKVLLANMESPFQRMIYKVGKKYTCSYFNSNQGKDGEGFYASGLDGIMYSYRPERLIFECEVGGESVIYNQFKQRFSEIELGKKLSVNEVKELIKKENYDWNVLEATFPVNPFKREYIFKRSDIKLVEKWDYVRNFVGYSVRGSVSDSVGHYVRGSVRDSVGYSVSGAVGYSVRGSVWAYISSLFPNIKKWKYIDHAEGENPFQAAIELWRRGAVMSYDGEKYRIHSKNGIEWEGVVK